MESSFPRLIAAVRAVGATHNERAKALRVSRQSIIDYLEGRCVPGIKIIVRHPLLIEAFCADAQALFAVADQVPSTE